MAVYQPGIPTGTVKLLSDYLNVQQNFQAANDVFGVDHTTLDNATPQKGYHTDVHFIPQTITLPATSLPSTPGYGQLFTQTLNDGSASSQQLFYQINNGVSDLVIPLTRNFLPAVGTNGSFPNNGYTFLPGGFILQWGKTPSALTSYPVVLASQGNINFTTNAYSVQATFGTVSTVNSPTITAIGPTGFTISWANGTSANTYWTAIGK